MSRPAALVDSDWAESAVRVIEQLARQYGTVTAEDLRKHHDEPEHQNQIGVAFKNAYHLKLIEPIGYRQSRDKSRRGGAIRVWSLHPRMKEQHGTEDH